MNTRAKPRGPRPSSIARAPGIDYGGLDRILGYQLRRAQLAGFEAFHHATAGVEITPPRFTALTIVGANPGLSQSDLGEALGTARSGAMLLTDWLEGRGLASRRRRNGDGRSWGLYLTSKGKSTLQRLRRRVIRRDAEFSSRLNWREQARLRKLLEKLSG